MAISACAPEVRSGLLEEALEASLRLDDEEAGELIPVRHAQPARGSGPDPMLSCGGLQQAEHLALRLSELSIDVIFAGPERRCRQTALLLSEAGVPPVHVMADLGGIEYRAPDGASNPAAGHWDVLQRTRRWDAVPGFEPGKGFRRRVAGAVERAIAGSRHGRVAVVATASVINAYLAALLAIESDVFFAPDHSSVSVVRWLGGRYAVRQLNDLSHLSGGAGYHADGQPFYGAFTAVNAALTPAT